MRHQTVLALFALLCGVLCLPILLHAHLPMVDLPNHLARHYLATAHDPALARYYTYQFSAKTNAAVDALWLFIGHRLMDVEAFSRLMFAIYVINFMAAILLLSRVLHGRWLLWPLGAGLLVYNGVFFWGFQNFLFTVPFALHGLALWLALEGRPPWLRALLFVPICWLLYEMHLLGFAVLLFTAFGREVQRLLTLDRAALPGHLIRHAVSGVPFAIPVLLTLHEALTAPPQAFGNFTYFGGIASRIQALMSLGRVITAGQAPVLDWVSTLLVVVLALILLSLGQQSGIRLRLADRIKGPVIALALVAAIMPFALNGVAYVNIRYPFICVALIFAGSSWQMLSRRQAMTLGLVLLTLGMARLVLIDRLTARYSRDVDQMQTLFTDLPAGARIMPVRMSRMQDGQGYWHMQAYAVFRSHAFVPTLFLGTHGIHVQPAWRNIAVAQGRSVPAPLVLNPELYAQAMRGPAGPEFWVGWRQHYTHLLAMDPLPAALVDSTVLKQIAHQGRFALYRILPDDQGTNAKSSLTVNEPSGSTKQLIEIGKPPVEPDH